MQRRHFEEVVPDFRFLLARASVRSIVVLVGSLVCLSCSGVLAKDDGRAFGDDLGRFRIVAVVDSSTCGAGALGAPENWHFEVVLSRDASRLYWNTNAAAIEGTVDAEGRFSFVAENVITSESTDNPKATCTIVRKDTARGAFDDPQTARAFDGSLEYAFAPQGTADCSDVMAQNGLLTLPCTMSYRLDAAWISGR
jgi:hypothetical protein